MRFPNSIKIAIITFLALLAGSTQATAQAYSTGYNIGNPIVIDVFVDPQRGSDLNDGLSPERPLQRIRTAWSLIPANQNLTTGYRINLMPGDYSNGNAPNWWADRFGTYRNPIIIRPFPAERRIDLPFSMNIFNVRYLYLLNLSLRADGGDVIQCAGCRNFLVRGCKISGGERKAYEGIKVNQSQFVYIEDSEVSGASDNTFDSMASQYGHLLRNSFSNSGSWCGYVKGGSAYWLIEGNTFSNCGEGGFTAGQGSGIEFSVAPWIQYQASNVKIINNVIYDVFGSGLGVNGGYNILLANNTAFRIGQRSHLAEFVFGGSQCDGDTTKCAQAIANGAWASMSRQEGARIPNRNVFFLNNLLFNPPGYESKWHHFFGASPTTNPNGVQPMNALADDNLRIAGNVVFNGDVNKTLFNGAAVFCAPQNSSCNEAQIRRDNAINTFLPSLVDPAKGNFRPVVGSSLANYRGVTIPDFQGGDLPSLRPPEGNLVNLVSTDFSGYQRDPKNQVVGAFLSSVPNLTPTPTPRVFPSITPTAETEVPTPAPTVVATPFPTAVSSGTKNPDYRVVIREGSRSRQANSITIPVYAYLLRIGKGRSINRRSDLVDTRSAKASLKPAVSYLGIAVRRDSRRLPGVFGRFGWMIEVPISPEQSKYDFIVAVSERSGASSEIRRRFGLRVP